MKIRKANIPRRVCGFAGQKRKWRRDVQRRIARERVPTIKGAPPDRAVNAHMPILTSRFHPPSFFLNGHIQTILPLLLPRRLNIAFERERLELQDGDFLDLDWTRKVGDKLAILSHGLEGCSNNRSNLGMATALQAAGWDALAWNLRGCGKEMNRLLRFYHSGETGDLGAVIRLAATRYSRIALIGFSL